MPENDQDGHIDQARRFVAANHRAVLVTRRASGGLQTSPVAASLDAGNRIVVSTQEGSAKERNIARDPRVSLCVVTDDWFGPWVHVDGTATILHLPEALEPLVDYYRRVAGEHPDWDEYRQMMAQEKRVLVQITPEHAGGVALG